MDEEQRRRRLDYWRMVLEESEEGSGVRALAERMISKYGGGEPQEESGQADQA